MNDSPLVSVIVPVYKVEDYLDACIHSLVRQTYPYLEIILVDDGSPDRCGAMCDDYAAQDPRIRVIHRENGGVANARNTGLEVASGTYLLFVDSDDVLPDQAIALLVEQALLHDADMVCGQRDYIDEAGAQIGVPLPQTDEAIRMDTDEALRHYAPEEWGPWNRLIRRQVHGSIRFPNYKIHEDEAIKFLLLERCKTVVRLCRTTYLYRQRAGSITSEGSGVDRIDMFYSRRENLTYLEQNHEDLVPLFLPKVLEDALLNLDALIRSGHRAEDPRVAQIVAFIRGYHRQLSRCPHTTDPQRLRVLLVRWSDWRHEHCLYVSFYKLLEKMRGR